MKMILDEKLFEESVYTENGFKDRNDYLNSLADDYGIDIGTVKELASVLGPSEDFDALVTELEDMMYSKFNDSDEDDEDLDKQFSLWSYYSPAMGASFVEDQIDLDWGDDPDVDEWIWNKCSKGFWVKLRDFFNLEDKFYRPVEFNDEGIEDLLVDDTYRKKAAEKSMNDYYDSSKEGKNIDEALFDEKKSPDLRRSLKESKVNMVPKEFTYTLHIDNSSHDVTSCVVVIPNGLKASDGSTMDAVVYAEDENGNEINFSSVDEAQKWIDTYKDNLSFRVKNRDELHATPIKHDEDIDEALNSQDQYDLSSAIYNAVSDVIFNSGKLDIDEKDVKFAFDRFIKKFFLDESLKK